MLDVNDVQELCLISNHRTEDHQALPFSSRSTGLETHIFYYSGMKSIMISSVLMDLLCCHGFKFSSHDH